ARAELARLDVAALDAPLQPAARLLRAVLELDPPEAYLQLSPLPLEARERAAAALLSNQKHALVLEVTEGAHSPELLYRRAPALIALRRGREVPALAASIGADAAEEPALSALRALAIAELARGPLDEGARAQLASLGRGPEPLLKLARQALAIGNL